MTLHMKCDSLQHFHCHLAQCNPTTAADILRFFQRTETWLFKTDVCHLLYLQRCCLHSRVFTINRSGLENDLGAGAIQMWKMSTADWREHCFNFQSASRDSKRWGTKVLNGRREKSN